MINLNIRNIDPETLNRLRTRTAGNGVSIEEEAHQILCHAVSDPEKLGDLAVSLFSPVYGGNDHP